ncbi:hypothetical protein CC1G_10423 [Coprinopsis cinerea okayama7|uniref:Uncharacterized protein n=1 Tax=Coprinopsis cinerea (strain Okayama-7 / 130 / ATCC MYA-4618 / FGSC 9003) TaxID=240176 RepID=A8PAR6_COPC7|nr:hypothetical protein CC1G_10423 [Coprinopsis cinerea okayama7\|eukprot:XP_001840039.1 hypothetical protein CC1G_10423 [Coprinopsis cinerea okayama7\
MSIRERSSSTSITTGDHKVRIVVRTEIEHAQTPSQPSVPDNEFSKLVMGVIAVDQKRLQSRLTAAMRDMNSAADAWSRLEEKLEETHGENFDLVLAGYPGKLDCSLDSLREALNELERISTANGRWINASFSRLNGNSVAAEAASMEGSADEQESHSSD